MTLTSSEISHSTSLFELGPNKFVSEATLKAILPDVETALFFAKAYTLDYWQLGKLLRIVSNSSVLAALMAGDHSVDLQDYLVDTIPEDVYPEEMPDFVEAAPHAEILPELWESLEIVVAKSIAEVAAKLAGTLDRLPGKQGAMVFGHLMKMNRQRPTIGAYQGSIYHAPIEENLVILDVSGSMTESTVRAIINDVVALSWKANAHLAIVSNQSHHWEPGSYNVDDVLALAAYGGTHYETLTPILERNWGTVITIADYDSSRSAKEFIRSNAKGTINTVLDISLVNKPTFLGECLGQIAGELRPVLIGGSPWVLGS